MPGVNLHNRPCAGCLQQKPAPILIHAVIVSGGGGPGGSEYCLDTFKSLGHKNQDKRTEPRTIVDEYYSVEFRIPVADSRITYQYKIRDISDHGMCLLVKEDSAVLNCFVSLG